MTLRVKEILHVEQSVYQDVLVFSSTDHVSAFEATGRAWRKGADGTRCNDRETFSSLTARFSVWSAMSSRELFLSTSAWVWAGIWGSHGRAERLAVRRAGNGVRVPERPSKLRRAGLNP